MKHFVEVDDGGCAAGNVEAVARTIAEGRAVVALTGAGVSVESGIPDFRSPGGLWSVFDPMDYATLTCFLRDPDRAWRLYRALGASIIDREPNPAHRALAQLEEVGRLRGLVTQNVDGLHQRAGHRRVVEMHGDHTNVQCLDCGRLEPFTRELLEDGPVPRCPSCARPMKPNVVLFEELVRHLDEVDALLTDCDVLIVAGTSASVAPASMLPSRVLARSGSVLEFNLEATELTAALGPRGAHVRGKVGVTLPLVVDRVMKRIES